MFTTLTHLHSLLFKRCLQSLRGFILQKMDWNKLKTDVGEEIIGTENLCYGPDQGGLTNGLGRDRLNFFGSYEYHNRFYVCHDT